MSLDNKLSLGSYSSQKKLLEAITVFTSIPSSVRVVELTTGVLNEGEENQRFWANLTVVDPVLYEQFESIGQEDYCPTFKVKLKGYSGEDLSQFQGMNISFDSYELAFLMDRFKQPVGLALLIELNTISIN